MARARQRLAVTPSSLSNRSDGAVSNHGGGANSSAKASVIAEDIMASLFAERSTVTSSAASADEKRSESPEDVIIPAQLEPATTPEDPTLAAVLEEKLRARREARQRAKDMIVGLNETAIAESLSDEGLVAGTQESSISNQSEADWFLGKSFSVGGGKIVEENSETLFDVAESEANSFVPRWMKTASVSESRKLGEELDENDNLADESILSVNQVVKKLEMERGKNITVLDVSSKCEWTDTIVIVEGKGKKQIFGLIDGVRRMAKKFVGRDPNLASTLVIEGQQTEDWMVLDLGRIIVHSMTAEAREFYDLEGLWAARIGEDSESAIDEEDENEERLVEAVSRAWDTRPRVLVKTKQLEADDVFLTNRGASGAGADVVFRRKVMTSNGH
ncbi:hypothetical protein HDU83_007659 [Entophlyctis luteolus]|nr:hypothetical protein HDU83_007659 [Entophlyctis luteolus]